MGLAPMLLYKWPFKRHILGYMVCFFFFFCLFFSFRWVRKFENGIYFFTQKVESNMFMNLLWPKRFYMDERKLLDRYNLKV